MFDDRRPGFRTVIRDRDLHLSLKGRAPINPRPPPGCSSAIHETEDLATDACTQGEHALEIKTFSSGLKPYARARIIAGQSTDLMEHLISCVKAGTRSRKDWGHFC